MEVLLLGVVASRLSSEGSLFESRSSHHVGDRTFTRSCLWRFGLKLVMDLKRRYRNSLNNGLKSLDTFRDIISRSTPHPLQTTLTHSITGDFFPNCRIVQKKKKQTIFFFFFFFFIKTKQYFFFF